MFLYAEGIERKGHASGTISDILYYILYNYVYKTYNILYYNQLRDVIVYKSVVSFVSRVGARGRGLWLSPAHVRCTR